MFLTLLAILQDVKIKVPNGQMLPITMEFGPSRKNKRRGQISQQRLELEEISAKKSKIPSADLEPIYFIHLPIKYLHNC
jgi:hypothetical protein